MNLGIRTTILTSNSTKFMMISLDLDGPEHDISNEFLMNLAIRTSILVSNSTNFMMISLDLDCPEHGISMNFL